MKRKAPLTLMELMVMILVFALAAALCLQAFAQSDRMSRDSEARDRAAVLCQSVAELIQHNGGDPTAALTKVNGVPPLEWSDFVWLEDYDEDWKVVSRSGTDPSSSYILKVTKVDSALPGLGRATVEAFTQDSGEMESLFSIEISWQKEVTGNG